MNRGCTRTGLEHLDGLIHNLRANAITRDDGDLLGSAVDVRHAEEGQGYGHSYKCTMRTRQRRGESRAPKPPVRAGEKEREHSRGGGVVAQRGGRGGRGGAAEEAAGQHGAVAGVLVWPAETAPVCSRREQSARL